jgi:uncharacterized protein YjbI with pentapeptide repeats
MDSDLTDSRLQGEIMESSHFGAATLIRTDFSGTSFKGRLWSEPSFLGANATDSNFSKCRIYGVDFSHANLENANFFDTSLELVEISNGNLKNTNFTKCYISTFNICSANLENTNFSDAIFTDSFIASRAKFQNTIFTNAKGNINKLKLTDTIYEKTGLPLAPYHLDHNPSKP